MAQQENRAAFEARLLEELRRAIKTQIETAYFSGTGSSSQPLGLLNTPGVQSKTYASAIPIYSELIDQVELLADANGDLAQARFFMHPSTLMALLKALVDASGCETVAKPEGDGYRIVGIRVHTSTSVTESKIILADVPTIHIVRYGPAMLLVDPFVSWLWLAVPNHSCCCWLQEWAQVRSSKQGEVSGPFPAPINRKAEPLTKEAPPHLRRLS